MPIVDLSSIDPTKTKLYSPKVVMNLCLGLLKLGELDPALKEQLTNNLSSPAKENHISIRQAAELWLASSSPFENDAGRLLVKYMSKLRIPPEVVLDWVTHKSSASVFHRCGDVVMDFICEAWTLPQEFAQVSDKMEGVEVKGQSSLVQPSEKQTTDLAQSELPTSFGSLGEFLVAHIPKH